MSALLFSHDAHFALTFVVKIRKLDQHSSTMKKVPLGKPQGTETLSHRTQSLRRVCGVLVRLVAAGTLILCAAITGFAAETATTNSVQASGSASTPTSAKAEDAAATATNNSASQELRVYLQLQEQLHATQLAVERIRKE